MTLWLLLGLARAVEVPEIDASVELTAGWTETELDPSLVENGRVQLLHEASGAGAILRGWPLDAEELPARAQRIQDLDAALSADHLAYGFATNQEDGSEEDTLYLGLSDVAGARVGRWVFRTKAHDGEPERIWWHSYWRTEGHVAQLIAWTPSDRLHQVIGPLRALETKVGTVSDYAPPASLLFQGGGACEGNASVDRMRAIAESGALQGARAGISAEADSAEARVAELTALGRLVKRVDRCVDDHARDVKACAVYERPSDTERSRRLQELVTACVAP